MNEQKVDKTITQNINEPSYTSVHYKGNRGIMVYSTSQLQQITGRDKQGRLLSWGVEQPYFYLTIQQRIEIFRLSSPVFGVITSRMNKIAGLDFNITSDKKQEDRIALRMRNMKSIYDEYSDSSELSHLTLKSVIYRNLLQYMPELKPDLSNFNNCMLRWKRNLQQYNNETCDNVKSWLMEPNQGVTWADFVKKWVGDYHIHGNASIYKDDQNGVVQNFDVLPGGTVYRIKGAAFNSVSGYIQVIPSYTGYHSYIEPQVYFTDEIIYSEYIPSSSRAYGMIPLEALINKIAESMLFDELMASQADGTKPPEKLVIITDKNPFGSLDDSEKYDMPLDTGEQKRIEERINTPTKGAIMTFSGNQAEVVDLSRESTMSIQMERQKDIREEVALVFNMSNMEVNLTGSEDTSGRSTSEAQLEIEQGKGIAPVVKALAHAIQYGLLPYKFGTGLMFEWDKAVDEREEKELDNLMLQTGEMTKNEIREKYNKEGFGEEYDKPDQGGMGEIGENEMNPMFTQSVKSRK